MSLVVDAFAWVEYFRGSLAGKKVGEYLEGPAELITLTTTLSELQEYALRHGQSFDSVLPLIYAESEILPINREIGIDAGKLNYERKKSVKGWGMMDSFVLSASLIHKAKILTGDPHFADVGQAIMI
jgi:predicted nucleic acid-binding protein